MLLFSSMLLFGLVIIGPMIFTSSIQQFLYLYKHFFTRIKRSDKINLLAAPQQGKVSISLPVTVYYFI